MDQSQSHSSSYPLPLTDDEIETILDDLGSFETPQEVVAQRTHVRLPYFASVTVVYAVDETADAGQVSLTAKAHDLSDGGLGLIAPHSLAEGTACVVTLVGPHGREESITGKLAMCEALEGRAHFWGVQFDECINAAAFLPARQAG